MIHDLSLDFQRYWKTNGLTDPSFFNYFCTFLNNPVLFTIIVYRFGYLVNSKKVYRKWKLIKHLLNVFYYTGIYLSVLFFKVQISEHMSIGPGLFLPRRGQIIIGDRQIGNNCTLESRVTIGLGKENISPIIGDNVRIGKNSIIYGNITVGSNVQIADNSVLSRSVPDNTLVSGNPARVRQSKLSCSV